ncbi:GA45A-like protein [Mya arenaria]|uniref:GA45A-like protein n=1 Tax=Mya arenaria TaxID=6604 RepID=A0ABY7G049_MYAAR|nr:GA45A-like protein [Mya arenaria]
MGKCILDVGNALVHVVKEALSQGRVTFGIFECVEVLETCPEQVMLCILPTVSDENILNLVNIQHKLIEAHCWENEVNLVKEQQAFLSAAAQPNWLIKIRRTFV